MKKWLSALKLGESGQAMLAVMALMVLGGFLVIPMLNFASTSLKTTKMCERNLNGLYAADAGVEDALWKLKYETPASFPRKYHITDINGLSVDIEIDEVDTIAGEPVGESGGDAAWLVLETVVTYDYELERYSYTLSATNNGSGNIKIEKILIALPPDVDYVDDSTSSNITNPLDGDPTDIIGFPATGITLVWANDTPRPSIEEDETKYHCFQLSGPPEIEGIEGDGFLKAKRTNIGTVWLGDVVPYTIIAEAKDGSGTVVAKIRAGVWVGSELSTLLDISCWQVNP